MSKSASFHFHGSLNDFLLPSKRSTLLVYAFNDAPSIKHAIESLGVPHPEVDVILVRGIPVNFTYTLHFDDEVEVYPVLSGSNFPETWSLTSKLFFSGKFILDVHLGKLARILRLF